MTATVPVKHERSGSALRLLFVTACLLALWLATEQRADWQSAWRPVPPVQLAFEGESYRVPAERVETLALLSALRFADGEEEARRLVRSHLRRGLDNLFHDLAAQLPEFADWYYSLGSEYMRISMLLLEKANLADGDYVARRAQAVIFDQADFDRRLGALRQQTESRLLRQARMTRAGWLADMLEELSAHRMPVPPPDDAETVSLDELLAGLSAHGGAEFSTRLSASGAVAAGAAAGPLLWRAVSRRLVAASSGRALAVRGTGRGAARFGTAAGGGMAVCAPGGPAAIACALAAGTAGWLAADWALLRLDEVLNRDELMAAMESGLAELRDELEQQLLDAYDAVLAEQYAAMQADIERTFVPVRAAGN